ncbi:MAG: hypothetical protein IJY20_04245 [Clostridia bacterium]|nr:hypothetical protein [Clostridia bacterium]
MTKRITSFVLALVMVLLCVPTLVFPATAADTTTTSAEDPIYIRFRLGDQRGYGYTGTVVKETVMVGPGIAAIEYPTNDTLLSYGIKPSDLLGWYVMKPDGTVIDANAYNGVYISEDLNFYPYLKSSSMGFNTPGNSPIISELNTTNKVLALRNGWTAGAYRDGTFWTFDYAPSPGLVFESGTSAWGDGSAYYQAGGGGNAMVLSKNANRVLGLSWTAIASGRVSVNLNKLTFRSDGPADDKPIDATTYLVITKNDQVIWPTAIAGDSMVTTGFADAGWYKASAGNAAALAAHTNVTVGAALSDVTVEAGDTICFYFGYANTRIVDCNPNVTYTTVGDLSEDILYTLPYAYEPARPMDPGQKPVAGAVSDTDPEVSYPGSWEMIVYDNAAAIANSSSATAATYYTKSDSTMDAFFTAHKDYGSAGSSPAAFIYGLGAGWGEDYSIAVQSNGGHRAAAGFRYTAEHAGYLKASFDAFRRCVIGWEMGAAGYNNLRFAIFVDGVMVWPTANGTATDYANWYKPYTVASDYKLASSAAPDPALADMTEEMNKALADEKFFVQQGSHVDFLITYSATGVSIWQGASNVMLPAVDYTDVFLTNFSASAAIGSSLALNFSADVNTASFTPSETKPYLQADTAKLTLGGGADGIVIGTPAITDGKLTARVSNITAKQMTETVNYTFTADVKKPGGETETLTLADGTLSVASYMKALYNATTDTALRDLALATLQYGAAAQTYFGYKTDALANAGISASLSFTPDAPKDKVAQSGNGDYYFDGATVLLEDTLQLKLLLTATDGARADWNSLYLAINGKKTNATISLRSGNTDGTYLKAILDVPFAEFSTDYQITLHAADGTQVSTTLTYSVDTYIARTANITAQADMLAAIRNVGVAALNYKTATAPTDDGEIVTRLVFLSDSHIGETTTSASPKLTSQLAQIVEWNKTTPIDAIVFPGDMTNLGIHSEYDELIRILTEAGIPDTIDLSFVLGNHEFSVTVDSAGDKGSYTDKPSADAVQLAFDIFNQYLSDVYHVNGEGETKFTVSEDGMDHSLRLDDGTYLIGLSMRGGGATYGEKSEAFLLQELEKAVAADPTKPILIYNHIGYGEIKGTSKMTLSAETQAVVNQYPQIVWMTGHTHYAFQDPMMIQQKNFTNIQLPTSGSKWWWVYSSGYTSPASYAYEANQGMIMTISDTNVIYVERYDFGTQETIGQKWRIDIPAILRSTANFTYKVADRALLAKAPEFATDAELTVEDVTSTTAKIKTPLATIKDTVSDNAVEYYAVIVTDMNDNIVFTQRKLSEYYRASRANQTVSFDIPGLKPNTEYKVYMRADSIFGKSSATLQTTFTTEESKDPREYLTEILNIDYSDGIADDRKGHALKTIGTPTLANGRATFAGNSAYQYTLTASDKASMDDTMTIETVLKVNSYFKSGEATESWGTYDALISNVESGGFGLNYVHTGGTTSLLQFLTYTDTATIKVQAEIALQDEIHVVATVGGGYATLYVDGVRVAQEAMIGNIKHSTATNPHYLLVGADTNGWGGFQCSSACSVRNVRLYAENVSAAEATLLYNNAMGIVTLPELTDILDIDYSTGSAADAQGHKLTTLTDGSEGAGPVFKDGKAVFDCKSAYQYMLTAADKTAMASTLTLETTLSVDATPDHATLNWGSGSLVSNVEAGGFGLKYTYSGGLTRLDFFSYTGTSNADKQEVLVSANIALKDEIHVVATIGNGHISLYVDGVLAATKAFEGNIVHSSATNPHTLLVGGDPTGYGALQMPAYCSVKNVHLYAECVTAEDAKAMYAAATNTAHLLSLEQVLKLDFANGSYTDACGHAATQRGNPVFSDGKAVMTGDAFGYKMGDEEYANVLQSMTLEMVVTIDSEYSKTGANALFANQNGGGFGLLYIPSEHASLPNYRGHLYFEFHAGGGYKIITCPVTLGEEMHIVVTYDGYIAHLYVNGELMGSYKVSGTIKDHGPNTVYVGADYGSGGDNPASATLQNYANASYDMVNLYAGAASYDQVQAMYEAAMGESEA